MTFSDKLIALRKKAGWSQEELAERLNVSRQSVSKWESAQSMPDIDKILQLSSLFSVTTDCLLKDGQDDPQPAAAQTPSPLPRVTLTQTEDYLTRAQANAPQMALATALCIVSPIPLLALGTVRELGLLGLDDNLAGGLGMIALLVLVAVAVVLFMQCGAAVREYEFLEKEPIETEHGNLDSIIGFRGDLVITMIDLTEELSQDPRVPSAIGIKNLVDKNEIREKLHAWLDEHKGEEPRR